MLATPTAIAWRQQKRTSVSNKDVQIEGVKWDVRMRGGAASLSLKLRKIHAILWLSPVRVQTIATDCLMHRSRFPAISYLGRSMRRGSNFHPRTESGICSRARAADPD